MHLPDKMTMLCRTVIALALLAGTRGIATTASAAELTDLIGGDAVKAVGDCKFTEGPAWHPDGYLLFSDIPNNRIVRVNTDGTSSDWLTDSGGANGLMCTQGGNVYAAQGVAGQVSLYRTGEDGTAELVKVVAKEYDGKPLNKPNDLALDTFGGLYFSDPNYGNDPADQPVEGVYYVSADGEVSRVVDDLPRPNGVLVTADGKSLLVANISERQIIKYDIEAPGKISPGQVIFTGDAALDGNGPDGMTFDAQGNIYATYKTVVALSPAGELIGRIEIPEKPANCAFGGDDNRTLYVTARTSLYSVPMKVAGVPIIEVEERAETADAATEEETYEVKARDVTLQIPKSWKQEEAGNSMRLAQITIDPVEGDSEGAELVLSGPFGGGVAQNAQRWVGQFASEGREIKMTQGEAPQGTYVVVDLSGTYNKTIGPPILRKSEPTPGYRMVGVILSKTDGGDYFLKLTGPEKTVDSIAKRLRKTFGGDADEEKPYAF